MRVRSTTALLVTVAACCWGCDGWRVYQATRCVNAGAELRRQGRLVEALAEYQRASELEPELAAAHLGAADMHLALGQNAQAIRSYRRVLEIAQDYEIALYSLGLAYVRLGRRTEAEGCFRRILTRNPAQAAAHLQLGLIVADRDASEGRFHLRRALTLCRDCVLGTPEAVRVLSSLGASGTPR